MDTEYNPDTTYKVSIGPVLWDKIPQGSYYWGEFNGAFKNQEVKHGEFGNYIYGGHTFTTWHNQWRDSKNYLAGQHLGIDFDTEDKRSEVDTLIKDPFIEKYAALVYTTVSHKIDAQRARVVFLLDAPIQQPANYIAAVSSLLWLFGGADRQCKDCVRFFYAMGQGGRIEWLPNVLPLSIVKDMIARYKATGEQQKRTIQQYTAQTADEQQVQDALKCIPPWGIQYDEWLCVLMAVHSAFPGSNGLAIADSWAQGDKGEVERKWRSFTGDGNTSGRIGLGTLFNIAKEHGYRARVTA